MEYTSNLKEYGKYEKPKGNTENMRTLRGYRKYEKHRWNTENTRNLSGTWEVQES